MGIIIMLKEGGSLAIDTIGNIWRKNKWQQKYLKMVI